MGVAHERHERGLRDDREANPAAPEPGHSAPLRELAEEHRGGRGAGRAGRGCSRPWPSRSAASGVKASEERAVKGGITEPPERERQKAVLNFLSMAGHAEEDGMGNAGMELRLLTLFDWSDDTEIKRHRILKTLCVRFAC